MRIMQYIFYRASYVITCKYYDEPRYVIIAKDGPYMDWMYKAGERQSVYRNMDLK